MKASNLGSTMKLIQEKAAQSFIHLQFVGFPTAGRNGPHSMHAYYYMLSVIQLKQLKLVTETKKKWIFKPNEKTESSQKTQQILQT